MSERGHWWLSRSKPHHRKVDNFRQCLVHNASLSIHISVGVGVQLLLEGRLAVGMLGIVVMDIGAGNMSVSYRGVGLGVRLGLSQGLGQSAVLIVTVGQVVVTSARDLAGNSLEVLTGACDTCVASVDTSVGAVEASVRAVEASVRAVDTSVGTMETSVSAADATYTRVGGVGSVGRVRTRGVVVRVSDTRGASIGTSTSACYTRVDLVCHVGVVRDSRVVA